MILPADICEGWWWVRWADGDDEVVKVVKIDTADRWQYWAPGYDRAIELGGWSITALERVALPSWERGDG